MGKRTNGACPPISSPNPLLALLKVSTSTSKPIPSFFASYCSVLYGPCTKYPLGARTHVCTALHWNSPRTRAYGMNTDRNAQPITMLCAYTTAGITADLTGLRECVAKVIDLKSQSHRPFFKLLRGIFCDPVFLCNWKGKTWRNMIKSLNKWKLTVNKWFKLSGTRTTVSSMACRTFRMQLHCLS